MGWKSKKNTKYFDMIRWMKGNGNLQLERKTNKVVARGITTNNNRTTDGNGRHSSARASSDRED